MKTPSSIDKCLPSTAFKSMSNSAITMIISTTTNVMMTYWALLLWRISQSCSLWSLQGLQMKTTHSSKNFIQLKWQILCIAMIMRQHHKSWIVEIRRDVQFRLNFIISTTDKFQTKAEIAKLKSPFVFIFCQVYCTLCHRNVIRSLIHLVQVNIKIWKCIIVNKSLIIGFIHRRSYSSMQSIKW